MPDGNLCIETGQCLIQHRAGNLNELRTGNIDQRSVNSPPRIERRQQRAIDGEL